MKPNELILRCYAEERSDGDCFAICLDLNLTAHAASFEEARGKLNALIRDYLEEALGKDKEHMQDLIPRSSPFYFWARYWYLCFLIRTHLTIRDIKAHFFKSHLPVQLAV